ncbi:T-cell immunomodulatory protein [Salix suchowensis]|nr:T-cell immunomodulatory protein [Salix suchowensis]
MGMTERRTDISSPLSVPASTMAQPITVDMDGDMKIDLLGSPRSRKARRLPSGYGRTLRNCCSLFPADAVYLVVHKTDAVDGASSHHERRRSLNAVKDAISATFLDMDEDVKEGLERNAEDLVHSEQLLLDAFFLKAIGSLPLYLLSVIYIHATFTVLNGACGNGWCYSPNRTIKYHVSLSSFTPRSVILTLSQPFGVSYAGASYKYTVLDTSGRRSLHRPPDLVGQLPQTAYHSLMAPYSYFGLGRTNNYIENLFVGSTIHSKDITLIWRGYPELEGGDPATPREGEPWKRECSYAPELGYPGNAQRQLHCLQTQQPYIDDSVVAGQCTATRNRIRRCRSSEVAMLPLPRQAKSPADSPYSNLVYLNVAATHDSPVAPDDTTETSRLFARNVLRTVALVAVIAAFPLYADRVPPCREFTDDALLASKDTTTISKPWSHQASYGRLHVARIDKLGINACRNVSRAITLRRRLAHRIGQCNKRGRGAPRSQGQSRKTRTYQAPYGEPWYILVQ